MKNLFISTILTFISFAGFSQTACCDFTENANNIGIPSETFGVKLGDLNGDGHLDAVTIDAYDAIEIWFNDGTGILDTVGTLSAGDFYGVELEDIDGDLDLDIIAIGFYSAQATEVWKNNGSGIFTLHQAISTNIGSEESKLADLDGDGDLDLLETNWMGNTQKIYKNDGAGTFTFAFSFTTTGAKADVALADFNGDGDIDAILCDKNGGNNEFWENDTTSFGFVAAYGQDDHYSGVASGDFDNDGDEDFVLVGMNIPAEVYLNDGVGNFTFDSYLSSTNYDKTVVVTDYNIDGKLDIVIGTYGSNGIEVWSNIGSANFELCYENPTGMSSHDLDVGDIDKDGLPDIYLGRFSSSSGDRVFIQVPGTTANASITLAGPYCDNSPAVTLTAVDAGGVWTGIGITNANTGIFNPVVAGVGTHQIIYTISNPCGDADTINIIVSDIDTTVTDGGSILTANATGVSYQWLNCSNNLTITGEINQSFSPIVNGSYAVILSDAICTDTSDCYDVIISKISEIENIDFVNIYPNPAQNYIVVEFLMDYETENIEILDIVGKTIRQITIESSITQINISDLEKGIYLIKVGETIHRLIKE